MKTKACPNCNGTGRVLDQRALGEELRELREASGKSLRDVAELLHISPPYLSDLERGNRAWSDRLISDYKACIKTK